VKNAIHEEAFRRAKEAQNRIKEDSRIRYRDSLSGASDEEVKVMLKERLSDKEFNDWYDEEFNE